MFLVSSCPAQGDGDPTLEFWPELDMWLRISPQWRFSVFVPVARNIETSYREGSVNIQSDFSWGVTHDLKRTRINEDSRAFNIRKNMIRAGYYASRSLNDEGASFEENTATLEFHRRIPVGEALLITNRVRTDFRFIGENHDPSYRIRYRLHAERAFNAGKFSFVPYLKAEFGYDSRFDEINRFRATAGSSMSHTPRYAVEVNLNYQRDSQMSIKTLISAGLILHIYFEV